MSNIMTPSYEPELLEGKTQHKNSNLKGVYRLKSGREIQADSKAEARLAQVMEDNGVDFRRISTKEKPPVTVTRTYNRYPDFAIQTTKGTCLVEVKGQLQREQRKKILETGTRAMENGFLYCVKLAGRKDRMIPSSGASPLGTDQQVKKKDQNMNQRNLRIFKEQCRKAGIPIIATLQDIEDAFDCRILDEHSQPIKT